MLVQNMTEDAKRLLDLIVQQIRAGRFIPGKPETYIGYKEVHHLSNLPRKGGTWGRSLQYQGLNDLADWVKRCQLPAITGLIVDTTKQHRPGRGYFTAFNNGEEDYNWWREEVRRAIAYDWSPYSKPEKLPTRKELQDFETLYSEGEKQKVGVHTRKRCEALISRAKSFFRSPDGELRCAVCSWSRPRATLKGDIVEIHHVCPVSTLPTKGTEWTFTEALKELTPLCPNCHRVAHSKPGGGVYSIKELDEIIKQ
jgi:hypothetical protein